MFEAQRCLSNPTAIRLGLTAVDIYLPPCEFALGSLVWLEKAATSGLTAEDSAWRLFFGSLPGDSDCCSRGELHPGVLTDKQ